MKKTTDELNKERLEVISKYKKDSEYDKNILAFILRGSVAHKIASNNSDLDIRLIVDEKITEQSNEYFYKSIPVHEIKYSVDYIKQGISENNLIIIDMVKNDVIIYEKNKIISELKESLQNYKVPREFLEKYLDSAKASFINAIDLYTENVFDAALLNLRDAAIKIAFSFQIIQGNYRPKQQWIVQQLSQVSIEKKEFANAFLDAMGLKETSKDEARETLINVAKMIQMMEREIYDE